MSRVVVDDVSLDLLNGAEVDFVEDLMGASFQIQQPERRLVLRLRQFLLDRLTVRPASRP